MITNRYFNWIAAILMGIAVAAMGVVLTLTQTKGFLSTATHFDYEGTLFDSDQVVSINIQVEESDWENLLANATDKEYIPADITINGKTITQVGIRAKGNTSLTQVASDDTTDRYSFKIEFDHYIRDQTFDGLDKLALNNVISDATYMKEYLSYQMLESIGVNVPKYGFADIKVNGNAWGLYFTVEVLEESFLQRNYGSDYGKLYKPESDQAAGGRPQGDGQQGGEPFGGRNPMQQEGSTQPQPNPEQASPPGEENQQANGERPEFGGFPGGRFGDSSGGSSLVYTDSNSDRYADIFDNAVTSVTNADKQRVIEALEHLNRAEDLEQYFDVDEILRYFAANTAMVNLDSYVGMFTHNYYLYEKDGKLSILPWDYNLSFAGFQVRSASDAVNFPIDTPTASGIALEDRPLIGKLLEIEEYQEKYHQYLQEIVTKYFDSGLFELTVTKLDVLLSPYVKNDATAFFSYEEYQAAVSELKKYGSLRAQSIQGQLNGTIPSTRDEQQKDSSALLDASSVNLSAMGSMGGGPMGREPGQMDPGNQASPDNTANSPDNAPGQTVSFGVPPGQENNQNQAQEAGKFGRDRRPPGDISDNGSPNGISPRAWWTIGICTAAMLLGLAFVIAFRRRRSF